jgi:hypothetical protein
LKRYLGVFGERLFIACVFGRWRIAGCGNPKLERGFLANAAEDGF